MTTTKRTKCPVCGKPVEWQNNPARPFCSDRCKLIDFGHWVDEEYSVPAEEAEPSVEEVDQSSAVRAGEAQS